MTIDNLGEEGRIRGEQIGVKLPGTLFENDCDSLWLVKRALEARLYQLGHIRAAMSVDSTLCVARLPREVLSRSQASHHWPNFRP